MKTRQEIRGILGEVETYGRAAVKSMNDLSHAVLVAGIGMAGLALDEGKKGLDKLVERGELAERDARQMFEQMLARSRHEAGQAGTKTEQRLGDALGRLGISTRSDLQELDLKIAALSQKLEELGAVRGARMANTAPPAAPAVQPGVEAPALQNQLEN